MAKIAEELQPKNQKRSNKLLWWLLGGAALVMVLIVIGLVSLVVSLTHSSAGNSLAMASPSASFSAKSSAKPSSSGGATAGIASTAPQTNSDSTAHENDPASNPQGPNCPAGDHVVVTLSGVSYAYASPYSNDPNMYYGPYFYVPVTLTNTSGLDVTITALDIEAVSTSQLPGFGYITAFLGDSPVPMAAGSSIDGSIIAEVNNSGPGALVGVDGWMLTRDDATVVYNGSYSACPGPTMIAGNSHATGAAVEVGPLT